MPRAQSVCAIHGCHHPAVAQGRCTDHALPAWQNSNRAKRLPRGWARTRAAVLNRDAHTCVTCGQPATDVDHIINNDNHDLDNLQALCLPCHKTKTAQEAAAGRQRRSTP